MVARSPQAAPGSPRQPQAGPGGPRQPQAAPGSPRHPQAAPGSPRQPQKGGDPSKIKKSVVLYSILNKSSYEKSGWIFRESSHGGEEPPGSPRQPQAGPGSPRQAQAHVRETCFGSESVILRRKRCSPRQPQVAPQTTIFIERLTPKP